MALWKLEQRHAGIVVTYLAGGKVQECGCATEVLEPAVFAWAAVEAKAWDVVQGSTGTFYVQPKPRKNPTPARMLVFESRLGTFSRNALRPYRFAVVCLGRGLAWFDQQAARYPESRAGWMEQRQEEARRQAGGGRCLDFAFTAEEAELQVCNWVAKGYVEVEVIPLTGTEPGPTSLLYASTIHFES